MRPRILAVDDDVRVLRAWQLMLGDDYELTTFEDPLLARQAFERAPYDAALLDLQMPAMDGLALLTQLRASQPGCAAIMITGHASVSAAVTALQLGAADFLVKPVADVEVLKAKIEGALARMGRSQVAARPGRAAASHLLVGDSPAMQGIRALLSRIAAAMAPTLILGESGTGKELAARTLHAASPRANRPFVAVNCAGLSETLIDSELFGHERGAFTGANARHKGLFEAAHGGVLFLDEVGELPASVQARLLRALQEGEVRPVGSAQSKQVSVWVVAATNRHPGQAIAEGRFRADLYYRLSTFCVEMPPLRARRDDLPALAEAMLARVAERTGRPPKTLAPETLAALQAYSWPGNVRELFNALEYASAMTDGPKIAPSALPRQVAPATALAPAPGAGSAVPEGAALPRFAEARDQLVADFEQRYLTELLRQAGDNLSEAARRSGMDRTNLRRLLRSHGLAGKAGEPGGR